MSALTYQGKKATYGSVPIYCDKIPIGHIPNMTSATTPSPFVISDNQINSTLYPNWYAFDGNDNTYAYNNGGAGYFNIYGNPYIRIVIDTPIQIYKIDYSFVGMQSPYNYGGLPIAHLHMGTSNSNIACGILLDFSPVSDGPYGGWHTFTGTNTLTEAQLLNQVASNTFNMYFYQDVGVGQPLWNIQIKKMQIYRYYGNY